MDLIAKLKSGHTWKFRRIGGIYQVELNSAEDLKAIHELDPKLWVALSCPVNGLELDRETLALIDSDADGRVRIEEMLAAVSWTMGRLSQPKSLFAGGALPLRAIQADDAEGKAILASAKQILANVGDDDLASISVNETADTAKIYGQSKLNGDGIIAADASDDPVLKAVIADIIRLLGPVLDRSGAAGIDARKLDQFFAELQSFEQWWAHGEQESTAGVDVFPMGPETPDAFAAFQDVASKIDDFFARCRLATFDPRAEQALNHDVKLFERLATEDFSASQIEVAALPLARIQATQTLPLDRGLNPEWAACIHQLHRKVLKPLKAIDGHTLSADQWLGVKQRFAGYQNWRNTKPHQRAGGFLYALRTDWPFYQRSA